MVESTIRFGVLLPATNTTMEPEMYKLAPEGVTVHFERLIPSSAPGERVTPASDETPAASRFLEEMGEDAPRAAKAVAMMRPKIIAFGCTAGSFFKGIEYDRELMEKNEGITGVPVITVMTAVVHALRELGLRKICLISPYSDSTNNKVKEFLQQSGFEVPSMGGLGLGVFEINEQLPEVAYKLAMSTWEDDCDGVFSSCTAFRTAEVLEKIESDLGKPVISSNQATMWLMLKKVGYGKPIAGLGKLMTCL